MYGVGQEKQVIPNFWFQKSKLLLSAFKWFDFIVLVVDLHPASSWVVSFLTSSAAAASGKERETCSGAGA